MVLAHTARADGDNHTVSLAAYLDHVREHHPFFRAEDLSVDIALKQQEGFTGAEDWQISAIRTPTTTRRISLSALPT
jgi:hypothetical protein